jgi:hypothetical protein
VLFPLENEGGMIIQRSANGGEKTSGAPAPPCPSSPETSRFQVGPTRCKERRTGPGDCLFGSGGMDGCT